METPKVPVTPVQPHDKSFKLSLLAGGGLLLIGLFSYFMAGNGGLFKGMIKLAPTNMTDLEACVKFDPTLTQIKEGGVYSATIQDEGKCGKEVQMLSDDEAKARVFFMRIDNPVVDKGNSLKYTFTAKGNYDTITDYKSTDYSWDFDGASGFTNSSNSISNIYETPVTKNVVLTATVKRSVGADIVFTANKTINVVAPEVAADPITFSIGCTQDPTIPLTANCKTETFTTIPDLSWSPPVWKSNPAASSGGENKASGGPAQTSFQYDKAGDYDVTLAITVNDKKYEQSAKVKISAAPDAAADPKGITIDSLTCTSTLNGNKANFNSAPIIKVDGDVSEIKPAEWDWKWDFNDPAADLSDATEPDSTIITYTSGKTETIYKPTLTLTNKATPSITKTANCGEIKIPATAAPAASAFLFADVFHATADSLTAVGDFTKAITVYPGDAVAIVTYAASGTGEPIKIRFNDKQWNFAVEGASTETIVKGQSVVETTCNANESEILTDIQAEATDLATNKNLDKTLKADTDFAKINTNLKAAISAIPDVTTTINGAKKLINAHKAFLGSTKSYTLLEFFGIDTSAEGFTNPFAGEGLEGMKMALDGVSKMIEPFKSDETTIVNTIFLNSIGFDKDALSNDKCITALKNLPLNYEKATTKEVTLDTAEINSSCLKDSFVSFPVEQNSKNACKYIPSDWSLNEFRDTTKVNGLIAQVKKGPSIIAAIDSGLTKVEGDNKSCQFAAGMLEYAKANFTGIPVLYTKTIDATAGAVTKITKGYTNTSKIGKKPSSGTLSEDGTLYTAAANYVGEDSIMEDLTLNQTEIGALEGGLISIISGSDQSFTAENAPKGTSLTCINVTAPKAVTQGAIVTQDKPATVTNTYVTNNYTTTPSAADQAAAAAAAAAKAAADKAAADKAAADKAALDSAPKVSRNKVAPSLNTGSSKDIKLPAFIKDTKTPVNFVDGGSSTGKYLSQLQSTYYNDEVFHGYKVGESLYFKGSDQITLAEFVKTIVYFSNLKPISEVTDNSKWYNKIMQAAQDGKLVSSSADPLQKVTIRQALEILYKAAGTSVTKAPASFKQYFADVPTTDKDYAILQDMAYSNIYIGKYVAAKHNADLTEFMTRADVSAFLNNWLLNAK